MARHVLDGKVALVADGGTDVGRSVALALAARGVRVIVAGADERALGETVGEIAYGGGKARHVVAGAAALERAVDRAFEVFGSLDLVVASADCALDAVARRIADGGRLILTPASTEPAKATPEAAIARSTLRFDDAVEPDDVAELVVFLCSHPRAFRSHSIAIGG